MLHSNNNITNCPICQEQLVATENGLKECTALVTYINGWEEKHYRNSPHGEYSWLCFPPYRIFQDYNSNETYIQVSVFAPYEQYKAISIQPLMSDEDAIKMTNRLKNLIAFL